MSGPDFDDPGAAPRPRTAQTREPSSIEDPPRRSASPERRAARFTAIYKREMPALTRFVMRMGADPSAAADAAHSAFAEAFRQLEKIDNPPAWLRTVASRAYFRQKLCPETPVEAVPDRPVLDADTVELSDQARAVYAALAALPERPRQVMAWHLDGYGTAEIARQLDISHDAVRQNLHRARKGLKQQLLKPHPGALEGGPTS